jgi:hypothetical protein
MTAGHWLWVLAYRMEERRQAAAAAGQVWLEALYRAVLWLLRRLP